MGTSNVIDTKSGTGWTIDVTACDLNTNLSEKDFVFLVDGTLANNADMTKTSATILTYGGADIGTNISVEVRRKTPATVLNTYAFISRFSSTDYNNEWDRTIRRWEEANLNGVGPGSTVTSVIPLDDAFGVGWDGDTVRPATRNALYDEIVLKAYIASPAFTGDPTAPTPSTGDNDTSVATTAFVHNQIDADLANSPALGGTPTAPNPVPSTDSTQIATTAWVRFYDSHKICGLSLAGALIAGPAAAWASGTARTTVYIVSTTQGLATNYVHLYNTTDSRWELRVGSGTISLSTSSFTASRPHDIFLYWTGSNLALEAVAWTNDTTRATALGGQDGVIVKTGDASRRYMGTVYVDGSKEFFCNVTTTGDTNTTRWDLYRQYNKELIRMVHELNSGDITRDVDASGVKNYGLLGTTGMAHKIMIGRNERIWCDAILTGLSISTANYITWFAGWYFGAEVNTTVLTSVRYARVQWGTAESSTALYRYKTINPKRLIQSANDGYYEARVVDYVQWSSVSAQVGVITVRSDFYVETSTHFYA